MHKYLKGDSIVLLVDLYFAHICDGVKRMFVYHCQRFSSSLLNSHAFADY